MSKGSHRRPRRCSDAEFTRRWALAFGAPFEVSKADKAALRYRPTTSGKNRPR